MTKFYYAQQGRVQRDHPSKIWSQLREVIANKPNKRVGKVNQNRRRSVRSDINVPSLRSSGTIQFGIATFWQYVGPALLRSGTKFFWLYSLRLCLPQFYWHLTTVVVFVVLQDARREQCPWYLCLATMLLRSQTDPGRYWISGMSEPKTIRNTFSLSIYSRVHGTKL